MNKLFIGKNKIEPRGACLFIHDQVPRRPLAQVFDPANHSLDLLRRVTPRQARDLAKALYAVEPETGKSTLTIRYARRALGPLLFAADRFDLIKVPPNIPKSAKEELETLISDLLFDPTIKSALTGENPIFALKPHTTILARLNRAEIGDDASLILACILIALYQGQVVIPDFGFYGRDAHVNLIRENRLIAGVNYLAELPPQLRRAALLIEDKRANCALHEDAVTLAQFAGLRPDPLRQDNDYDKYIQAAMA